MITCCSICRSDFEKTISVKEEMYAIDEHFSYGLCAKCGCLECLEPPKNMSKFYPANYYSFGSGAKKNWFKSFRRGLKRRIILWHPNLLTKIIYLWLGSYQIFWTYRRLSLKKGAAILDVGAGGGDHVFELRSAGFRAVGVDPFLGEDIKIGHDLVVHKGSLVSIKNQFDLITFHHSFEHIDSQHQSLEYLKTLLKPGGRVLIRIPTVTSDAFDQYQEKWCQLDAPRHLYLHSHRSIEYLANHHGFEIKDLWCDSSEGQFIYSEQYKSGISLYSTKSYLLNKSNSIFNAKQIKEFRRKAVDANKNLRGDQICVVLKLTDE
jgi:SAM-dependent methyltransferase